jgi:3-oxoadipate enol-lactonase
VRRTAAGRVSGIPRRVGHLESDGEKIYYELCGEGPPLVLCHGLGGNHGVWYGQVACFARTHQVVSWDHRGFGRSTDRAARSGPEVATADLHALLDHLALDRVDLVGQSMGGWTALGLALAEPERVRRLVLADSLGGIVTPQIERTLLRDLRDGRGLRAPPSELGLHPALDPGFTEREPERAHLYQMLGGMGSPDVAKIGTRLLACTRSREQVAHLDLPVLFVVGSNDPLIPPDAVREAAAVLPDARVIEIPGSGHSPYFEDPAAWNTAVRGFLDS